MGAQRRRSEQTPARRQVRWWLAILPIVLGAAAISWFALARARPTVAWSDVLAAAGQRQTMNGLGSLSMKDGSEWEYALWVRMGGPGVSVSGGMLLPVSPPPGGNQMPAKLDEDLEMLCRAMDYFGEGGVVARLAAREKEKTPARRVELGGESVPRRAEQRRHHGGRDPASG